MSQVLVDVDQVDRELLAAIRTACTRIGAEVVATRDAREHAHAATLIVGTLRRGERRVPQPVLDLMTLAPDAGVLLLSEDPLIRPSVTTHGGRITLLSRPTSAPRVRGAIRMLLGEPRGSEYLDGEVWTAIVGGDGSIAPAVRRDDVGLTAVYPLAPGWSGAHDLVEEVDLIVQARIEEDERLRRLRELLGKTAGMIHLSAQCRQWVTYWPTSRTPLLLCSPVRLPRICNIADGVSTQLFTLNASPGDLVIATGTERVYGEAIERSVRDGGGAFVECVESLEAVPSAALVVEVR